MRTGRSLTVSGEGRGASQKKFWKKKIWKKNWIKKIWIKEKFELKKNLN